MGQTEKSLRKKIKLFTVMRTSWRKHRTKGQREIAFVHGVQSWKAIKILTDHE